MRVVSQAYPPTDALAEAQQLRRVLVEQELDKYAEFLIGLSKKLSDIKAVLESATLDQIQEIGDVIEHSIEMVPTPEELDALVADVLRDSENNVEV